MLHKQVFYLLNLAKVSKKVDFMHLSASKNMQTFRTSS
ncbi:hypothetical protein TFKS16_1159 [Tannerella forsythia KS16]|uniref:Uncharacterized protein n=1 Tax=Tannerella forsythia (strain ATCC 43037 / JCM 10827 / CCUG 21028 A / KCTC 5666 / FDC 338) TaxID=203275 RepID=G8UQK0_TANFA|nr:hypothetical protein BFO_0998 [Tannerella forsythia 92A2]BAR48488.1 hypothetical protein TF3313_0934 [Tannerella forsythia 3313]BAR51428.1 hypothetical protein TFKS16_1159 [Tannerella forsythia KS16]